LNANCCVGVSYPFAMYGSVLFQTNTSLHIHCGGVGHQHVRLSSSGSSFSWGASMGFDEGQKMKVWLFVSWFFPLASLLGGRELGQLVLQTWLDAVR